MKSIYGAGVFDRCLDDGVHFDYAIGVSAGSANVVSFLGNQRGRNYRFYTGYALRPEYMGFSCLKKTGNYLNLDYIYGGLSNAGCEDPLGYTQIMQNPAAMKVVATCAETGLPVYFDKQNLHQDDYRILMASSAIPLACRPYKIGRRRYFDGGLSDPVPVRRALQAGCSKIVLILTHPESEIRSDKKDRLPAKLLAHRYPHAARALLLRSKRYNEGVSLAKRLRAKGKLLIVSPEDLGGAGTLTRDPASLSRLYDCALEDGAAVAEFLKQ